MSGDGRPSHDVPAIPDVDTVSADWRSLSPSATNYPVVFGRRYHRYHQGAYLFPNDQKELDRLDMQFHILKAVNNGKIYFAPLRNPRHILDVGTGSGIWPISMASIFPDAEIIGTDLSPVQPVDVPQNVLFYVDDASEEDWLWPENHFDLIHSSFLIGSVVSFKNVLQNALRYIKPGGWVECHDFDARPRSDDGTVPPSDPDCNGPYAFLNWYQLGVRGCNNMEPPRPISFEEKITQWMHEIGFVNVQQLVRRLPVNGWPEDPKGRHVGNWMQQNWMEALAGYSYTPFVQGLGWSKDEVEVFLVDVRKSIQDQSVHAYSLYYIVIGQKPG